MKINKHENNNKTFLSHSTFLSSCCTFIILDKLIVPRPEHSMKTSVSVLHKATTNLLSVHRHTHTVCACSRCCLGVLYGFLLVPGDQYCQICFDNVLAVFAISNTNKGAFAEKRKGSPLIKAVICTPVTDRVVESILDSWNSTYKIKPQNVIRKC